MVSSMPLIIVFATGQTDRPWHEDKFARQYGFVQSVKSIFCLPPDLFAVFLSLSSSSPMEWMMKMGGGRKKKNSQIERNGRVNN